MQTTIDQYLDKILEGEALAEFEKRMQEDKAFSESVAAQKLVRQGLKQIGREDLKQKLEKIHREMEAENFVQVKPQRSSQIKIWYYAASIALLIVAGFFIYKNQKTNLFAQDDLLTNDTLGVVGNVPLQLLKAESEAFKALQNQFNVLANQTLSIKDRQLLAKEILKKFTPKAQVKVLFSNGKISEIKPIREYLDAFIFLSNRQIEVQTAKINHEEKIAEITIVESFKSKQ